MRELLAGAFCEIVVIDGSSAGRRAPLPKHSERVACRLCATRPSSSEQNHEKQALALPLLQL